MGGKIKISKEELINLYYNKKRSTNKIALIYNCSSATIQNRLKEYNMKPLNRSIIQSKYTKKDFSGDNNEKAYISGFRLGDLNVYKTSSHSKVTVIRCNTTDNNQIRLIKKLFGKYGHVTCSQGLKSFNVNCFLNDTFDFLLKKDLHCYNWINSGEDTQLAFIAGYVDAEANIGVYDGRARFKIDSYDKEIIDWLYIWCQKNFILCPTPIKIGKEGQIYQKIFKYNRDVWRIRISKMDSLYNFLEKIKPFVIHKRRLSHINKCLKNIDDRRSKKNN